MKFQITLYLEKLTSFLFFIPNDTKKDIIQKILNESNKCYMIFERHVLPELTEYVVLRKLNYSEQRNLTTNKQTCNKHTNAHALFIKKMENFVLKHE